MSTSASVRGWGSGWPNCQWDRFETLVRSDGLRLPIHEDLVELVSMLLDLTEAMGYDVVPTWTWGVACRAISGTSTASNHSWGLAVDINAPVNPQKSPLTTNIPPSVVSLWRNHGFRWGGDYNDPMHFEFMGSPADAARYTTNLRNYLAGLGKPPAPVWPKFQPGSGLWSLYPFDGNKRVLRKGDRGDDVRYLKGVLRLRTGAPLGTSDRFSWLTELSVKRLQKYVGMKASGVVDRRTWDLVDYLARH